jgi:hypothetical protein
MESQPSPPRIDERKPNMPVNVRSVQGRRKLRFASLDEMLADAESVATAPNVYMLGNLTLSQILSHLSLAMNGSIDGIPGRRAPFFFRTIGRLILPRILKRGISPGVKLRKDLANAAFPTDSAVPEALGKLKLAVSRVRSERMTSPHPFFGHLTHDQWMLMHLRHAELHLSFASLTSQPPQS